MRRWSDGFTRSVWIALGLGLGIVLLALGFAAAIILPNGIPGVVLLFIAGGILGVVGEALA